METCGRAWAQSEPKQTVKSGGSLVTRPTATPQTQITYRKRMAYEVRAALHAQLNGREVRAALQH